MMSFDFEMGRPADKKWIELLIYGEPGVGKTTFCGTADDVEGARDVLFLDCDGGLSAIDDREFDSIKIDNFEMLDQVIEWLRLHCRFRKEYERGEEDAEEKLSDLQEELPQLEHEPDRLRLFHTVVVDNLSEIQSYSLSRVMDNDKKNGLMIEKSASQNDWGKSNQQMENVIREFRDLDMHSVFTAWKNRSKDEDSGAITIAPDFGKSVRQKAPGMVENVAYMFVQEDKEGEKHRVLQLQQTSKIVAKSRTIDKEQLVDPTFEDFYNELQ